MRRRILLAAVVIGSLWFLAGAYVIPSFTAPSPPAIRFQQAGDDLGVVDPHSEIVVERQVWNVGRRPLEVSRIETSCGCSSATLSRNPIGPGERAILRIVIRPKPGRGPKMVKVDLCSNDPKTPVASLILGYRNRAEIHAEPDFLDFGPVAQSELPRSRKLRWVMPAQGGFSATDPASWDVVTDHPKVIADIPQPKSSGSLPVIVRLEKGLASGPLMAVVRLRREGREVAQVPVRAIVRGDFTAAPSQLDLGPIRSSDDLKVVSVVVRSVSGTCRIERVEISEALSDWICVTAEYPGRLAVMKIEVVPRVLESPQAASCSGTIRAFCDDGKGLTGTAVVCVQIFRR